MIHRIIRRGFGIIEAERLCTIEQDLGHHETGKKRGGGNRNEKEYSTT